MYAEQLPAGRMLPDHDVGKYEIKEMSMRQFLERSGGLDSTAAEPGVHHYLTMPAQAMGGNLLEIAPGWKDLVTTEALDAFWVVR